MLLLAHNEPLKFVKNVRGNLTYVEYLSLTYSATIQPGLTSFLFGRACAFIDFRLLWLLCGVSSLLDTRKVIIFLFM